MVLLHVKQSEDQQFLFECKGVDYADTVIRDIVTVHNLQLKIAHLKEEGDLLAEYGPYKDPKRNEADDTDDEEEELKKIPQCSSSVKQRGPFYKHDPSNKRTGEGAILIRFRNPSYGELLVTRCDPEVTKKLKQALAEAELCASKTQVSYKVPLTAAMLKEAISNVRGAVTICYPTELPPYDPVQQELVGAYKGRVYPVADSQGFMAYAKCIISPFADLWPKGQNALDPDAAVMWWTGKEFKREKKISDHVGKNDKTKVIVKLTSPGHGAPPREPPVDSETQKAMMAWYYKKQEEQKKLQLDEDDAYTNSEWGDPNALKSALHQMSKIKMR